MWKIWDMISFLQYGDLPTSYFTKRGMRIGKNFNRQSGVRMDPSHCWLITIGDDVTISNKVQILAHDDVLRVYTGYGRIAPVTIGDRVFIGANSTILMNTHIGDDVIIGAGSLVTGDIPAGSVVAGVPAKVICQTADLVEREKAKIGSALTFDKSYSYYQKVGREKKTEMQQRFAEQPGIGYLELGKYEEK